MEMIFYRGGFNSVNAASVFFDFKVKIDEIEICRERVFKE
jgi:hypothetical protein